MWLAVDKTAFIYSERIYRLGGDAVLETVRVRRERERRAFVKNGIDRITY